MLLIGAILTIGLLLGWGLGGGLRYLPDARIRAWWLAPLALVLQVAPVPEMGGTLGRFLPVGALLLSFLLLMAVVIMNLRNRGFGLILLGLTLNLTVIGLNRGMPVSEAALREVGAAEDIPGLRQAARGEKHHLAGEDDYLTFLGDTIPVRSPFDSVVSPGDVLMYGGGAVYLGAAMLGRSRRARESDELPEPTATWS